VREEVVISVQPKCGCASKMVVGSRTGRAAAVRRSAVGVEVLPSVPGLQQSRRQSLRGKHYG